MTRSFEREDLVPGSVTIKEERLEFDCSRISSSRKYPRFKRSLRLITDYFRNVGGAS